MTDVRRTRRSGQKSSVVAPKNPPVWLDALRTAIADADAVTRDMLRPPSKRELGPVNHRTMYESARLSIVALLATGPAKGGDPG